MSYRSFSSKSPAFPALFSILWSHEFSESFQKDKIAKYLGILERLTVISVEPTTHRRHCDIFNILTFRSFSFKFLLLNIVILSTIRLNKIFYNRYYIFCFEFWNIWLSILIYTSSRFASSSFRKATKPLQTFEDHYSSSRVLDWKLEN